MRFSVLWLPALLCFIFSACGKKEKLPLSEQELVSVLVDVHAAEAALVHLTAEDKDSLARIYYDQIMEIHGVKREDFDTCVAMMMRDPELMQEIYEQVTEAVNKSGQPPE